MLLENHATASPCAIVLSVNVSAERPLLLRIVSGAGTDLPERNKWPQFTLFSGYSLRLDQIVL